MAARRVEPDAARREIAGARLRRAGREREGDVERADGEGPAQLQSELQGGAVRFDVDRAAAQRAAPLRRGVQAARQRPRHRGRKERNELGEMRRVERRRDDIVAAPRLPLPLATSRAEPAARAMFTLRSASRVTVPAAVPDSATPASLLDGASATSTTARHARREHAGRGDVRVERAGRKGAEARGIEAARLRVELEGALSGEPDATAARELAPRRGEAKVFDVDRAVGNGRGEAQRDAARDGAIGDVAADPLAAAVEVGADRSGEPRDHERRVDRFQIDVGDGERPRARAAVAKRNAGPAARTAAARELRREVVEHERVGAPREARRQRAQGKLAGVERAGQRVGRVDAAREPAAAHRLRARDHVEPRRGQRLVPGREIEIGGIDGDRDQRHHRQRRQRRVRREARAARLAAAVDARAPRACRKARASRRRP